MLDGNRPSSATFGPNLTQFGPLLTEFDRILCGWPHLGRFGTSLGRIRCAALRFARLKFWRTVRSSEIRARLARTTDRRSLKETAFARAYTASSSLSDAETAHMGHTFMGSGTGGSASPQEAHGVRPPIGPGGRLQKSPVIWRIPSEMARSPEPSMTPGWGWAGNVSMTGLERPFLGSKSDRTPLRSLDRRPRTSVRLPTEELPLTHPTSLRPDS